MGIKPICILRGIILLTIKNPLAGSFLRRRWLHGVLPPPRLWRAIIRQFSGHVQSRKAAGNAHCGRALAYNHRSLAPPASPRISGQSVNNSIRKRIVALLIAITLGITAVLGYFSRTAPTQHDETDYRMPAGKPLLEPNRPDLIGDPGIADDDEQGDIPHE